MGGGGPPWYPSDLTYTQSNITRLVVTFVVTLTSRGYAEEINLCFRGKIKWCALQDLNLLQNGIFQGKTPTTAPTESKLNQLQPDGDLNGAFKGLPKKRHRLASSGMELPETVSYRNLTARITHSAKDDLYHAYWNCGGHRGKAASKKFERAKEKALAALPRWPPQFQ